MATVKKEEDDAAAATIPDLSKLFPPKSIKNLLQENKDMGKIRKDTEELVTSCSALFLKKLLKESVGEDQVVTLDKMKQATAKYSFVQLDEVDESAAPKAKRRKRATKKVDADVSTALAQAQASESIKQAVQVVQDEDDYD